MPRSLTEFVSCLLATLALLSVPQDAFAGERRHAVRTLWCATDVVSNFTTAYRLDLNQDFNDYGLLADDAGDELCSAVARDRLLEKLRNTLTMPMHADPLHNQVGPYQGWLEGAHVSLIFAAALEIAGRGNLTTELDEDLQRVRDSYRFLIDPSCGFSGVKWQAMNTCMDDHAVAASAYGWIAAYERARGRDAARWVSLTGEEIHASFGIDSVCVHDRAGAGTTPCNATAAQLRDGAAETLSFNHGQQSVHYGFGQLTSVVAAMLGLHYAGASFELSADERALALGLYAEAARKSDPEGSAFKNNCVKSLRYDGGSWIRETGAACGEAPVYNYQPRMYHLDWFFDRFVGPRPAMVADEGVMQSAYAFDVFDPALFSNSPFQFLNAARRVTYGELAYLWWFDPPPMPNPQ